MKNIKKYSDFQTINEFVENNPELSEIEKNYAVELGKKGELSSYLREHGKVFTFGILKNIFKDALEYKKTREMKKGAMKFLHGVVPMVGGMFLLPISLIGMFLGSSRALNNVLTPVIQDPTKNYNSFLYKFVTGVFDFAEGTSYKKMLEHDWFWDIFVMKDDLVKMIRKEHMVVFCKHLADKMEQEADDNEVPHNYIENELKIWLNETFKIDPPMELKESRD